ncbi:MAG: alpha-amylase family glycosyl hydrolase [Ignavibacteria bacterium]|nr:alpha-amylase family glycosyl hydrolase [Ignavibacteria bacterium]
MRSFVKSILILTFLLTAFLCSHNQTSSVSHPAWSYNKTIYEVNIRQYSKEGTFKAFEKHLPRLKKMGVGILWLMPIHPIGEKNRKGTLGNYYSVKDYKDVNPEFGTLKEFKSLIDKIHKMGMYVIIDWVANHTAWDNIWMSEHPEFYTKDSLGNFYPPVPDWADVADLNYDNKNLWAVMIDALKFWIQEYDIDGYRCDVAGMIPIEFWIETRKELDKIKPVFMLAEWDTPEMHKAFDMSYDWSTHKLMNAIAKGEKTAEDMFNNLNNDKNSYPQNAFRMHFTSNHDEKTWNGTVFERLGRAAKLFAVLSFLIPDMPLIYTGQEAGLNKRLAFFDKDEVEWKEHEFRKLYSHLIKLKNNNEALSNGETGSKITWVNSIDKKSILAFTRTKNKDKIFVIFNFSDKEVEFELDGETIMGTYKNYFTGKIETFKNKGNFNLKPWEYRVYAK